MDFIKLIIKFWILNTKQLISTKTNIILFAVFPIIALFIPIIFIPVTYSIGLVFVIALLPVNGAIFASNNFSINNSTLRKNLNLRHNARYSLYLATLITMVTVTLLLAFAEYVLVSFLWSMNMLKSNWFEYDNLKIGMNNQLFVLAMYVSVIISGLTFAISFATMKFFKSINTYFIMIFSMMTLAVIFGATFNTYGVCDTTNHLAIKPWADNNISLMSGNMFIPSIIFPYYAPAQILTLNLEVASWWPISYAENGNSILQMAFTYQSPSWTWFMLYPWIEMAILVLIGAGISHITKK